MIKAVINIIGLKPGDTLLDPMMGSGTACLEASLQGIDSVGIDASPFCVLMAEGKRAGAAAPGDAVDDLQERAEAIFDKFGASDPEPSLFRKTDSHHPKSTRIENGLDAFLHLCYLDAMGYAARRASKSARELFPVVLQRYVGAVRNFARVRDELGLSLGMTKYMAGDARDLAASGISDESIDGIVTSPPYSFAIDYLANDAAQLEYLSVDVDKLRESMIGLRGTTMPQRVRRYLDDMSKVFQECARVLKARGYAVFVVGTNSNQLKRVMGTAGEEIKIDREFVQIASSCSLQLAQDVIHPIEGIHNTLRDEHLLFFRKIA
jgi:DNA modification methylase